MIASVQLGLLPTLRSDSCTSSPAKLELSTDDPPDLELFVELLRETTTPQTATPAILRDRQSSVSRQTQCVCTSQHGGTTNGAVSS